MEVGSLAKPHLERKKGQEQPKHAVKTQMKNTFHIEVVKQSLRIAGQYTLMEYNRCADSVLPLCQEGVD